MTQHCYKDGFSLIELLIALAIVSLLSVVGTPIYTQHVAHAHRLEALVAMNRVAAALEQYYAEHQSYIGATLQRLHQPSAIVQGRYLLRLKSLSLDNYLVSVRAINVQAEQDELCTEMTLDATGEKSVIGEGSVNECWQ